MTTSTTRQRQSLARKVFGPTMPRLWCPPITHYAAGGTIHARRMEAHWRTMVNHVGGFLIPGSTGDGWQMSEDEIAGVLEVAIGLAIKLDTRLLIGVLRTDVDAMLSVIDATIAMLKARAGSANVMEALRRCHVSGFTVCPPQGADLSQSEIQSGLEAVLDLGLPTAIYQLPQVTRNEISPSVFKELAANYGNFLLFKDTSGEDRVPSTDRGASGVFLVRGAEGDYAQWLREGGGCYDGLLLSSANGFSAELAEMMAHLEAGDLTMALALSARIAAAVRGAFEAVAALPEGNAFAAANKAIDHVRAYGPMAQAAPPPLLHTATRMPHSVISEVVEVLDSQGFLPVAGYLEEPTVRPSA